eukprot:6214621-Pleurochrysis_carterae.AAC.3
MQLNSSQRRAEVDMAEIGSGTTTSRKRWDRVVILNSRLLSISKPPEANPGGLDIYGKFSSKWIYCSRAQLVGIHAANSGEVTMASPSRMRRVV